MKNYRRTTLLLGASVLGLTLATTGPAYSQCTTTATGVQTRSSSTYCVDHRGRRMSSVIDPRTGRAFGDQICRDQISATPSIPTIKSGCTYQVPTPCPPPPYSGDGDGDGSSYQGAGGITYSTRDDAIASGGTGHHRNENPDRHSYNPNSSRNNNNNNSSSNNDSCFVAGTMVSMFDGTEKPIEEVKLGDRVAIGGRVHAVGAFFARDIYSYKGILVSGSHAVNEDGYWMRVRDSSLATLVSDEETVVYIHANEHHRIIINGVVFSDYDEIDLCTMQGYEGYDRAVLRALNTQENNRVDII